MKTFIISLLLVAALFTKAQIVNIPDANFKNYLLQYSPAIDINNDNEIQVTEAAAVGRLLIYESVNNQMIASLVGLESFSNLTYLETYTRVPVINTAGLNNLKEYRVGGYVNTLDLTGCFNLENLNVGCDSLTTLDISPCANLKELIVGYNLRLTNIIKATHDSLKVATIYYNNSLRQIDFSNLHNLLQLHITTDWPLERLNVDGCNALQYLSITGGPPITPLNTLDLSSCYNLLHFGANYFRINYLNVKNGSSFIGFTYDFNNSVEICADEFEIQDLQQRFMFNLMTPPPITSYCTFFPGGNYNTIKGKTRIDFNNDGCDSTDRVMQQVAIKIQDTSGNSLIRYTAQSGDYAHYSYKGNFTLTPYFPYPYFIVNPASVNVLFDSANNLVSTKDFCIQPNGTHNDLEISFLPTLSPARPGFNAAYTLIYKNRGTTTLSGNVAVNFDNNKMNFVSASENVTTQSSGQLLWNYNNLQPFETKTIDVTFNLLPPPVNNIDDTISYLAVITPSDNDETAFDNIFILPQRVVGSFDPNDKQCIEGSKLDISKIGDYLHYQIRFQNEGTDTAFNIVVVDTLSDKLDWNSFEFISSSHSCNPTLKNNKAEFIFENINLPYKAIDEPGSNGWVAFKIKPKPSVVIGDSLNNSAAIYFDFNLPVITNTATTIVTSSSTPVPVKLEYFSVNKKENTNQLNWKASCTYGNAAFVIERSDDGIHFKAIGNINTTALRCQLPFNFTDNNPAAGKNYYRLKITDADGKSFYSKIVVVGNNKAGIEITAVANNTVYLNSNKQQIIQLKVIAADGKEIVNQKQIFTAGTNSISLQTANTAKGIYTIIIYTNDGSSITHRFIK
ncbi:MAG: T9SS type A sorting domain-containing protein [Bacteroidota bacterium]